MKIDSIAFSARQLQQTASGPRIGEGSYSFGVQLSSAAPAGEAFAIEATVSTSSPDRCDSEVVYAGERTREQRDAEGRKKAINLISPPAKAPRSDSAAVVPAPAAPAALSGLPTSG